QFGNPNNFGGSRRRVLPRAAVRRRRAVSGLSPGVTGRGASWPARQNGRRGSNRRGTEPTPSRSPARGHRPVRSLATPTLTVIHGRIEDSGNVRNAQTRLQDLKLLASSNPIGAVEYVSPGSSLLHLPLA